MLLLISLLFRRKAKEGTMEACSSEWERIGGTGEPPLQRSNCASCVINGKLYVFGGIEIQGSIQTEEMQRSDFWKYSFIDNTWETIHTSSNAEPCARDRMSFAVCGRTIYLFGGEASGLGASMNDFWKFDTQSEIWTQIHLGDTSNTETRGTIPDKRHDYVCTVYKGKFFLYGGMGRDMEAFDDLHMFDLKTSLWTEIQVDGVGPESTIGTEGVAVQQDSKNFLYIREICDDYKHGAQKSNFFALGLDAYAWEEIPSRGSLPPSRFSPSLCSHGDHIYELGEHFAMVADFHIYNISSNLWTTAEECRVHGPPIARNGCVFHGYNNSIYLLGGNDGITPFTDFFAYRVCFPYTFEDDDFQRVVGNPSFVCFLVEGKKVRAHKNILVARSMYFRSMFSHDMRESTSVNNAPIEIRNVSFGTFRKVIEYLCADEFQGGSLEENKELLLAGDFFRIPNLKYLCEDQIARQQINNKAVVSVAIFSHRYVVPNLKQCAMEYLVKHWDEEEVKNSRFELNDEPELMNELTIKLRSTSC